MFDPQVLQAVKSLADDYKFWLVFVGAAYSIFQGFTWVKEIRTKDLVDVHAGIQELKTAMNGLGQKVDNQTRDVVGELKEMRRDFQMLILPTALMAAPASGRKSSKPRKRTVKVVNSDKSSTTATDLQN